MKPSLARSTIIVGSILVGLAVLFYIIRTELRLQDRLDEIEPKATKYDQLCAGVAAALHTDRRLLRSTDARDKVLRRVGNDVDGDDSYRMMERCLPEPFPMEAWQRCVAEHDDDCLDNLLRAAETSIQGNP